MDLLSLGFARHALASRVGFSFGPGHADALADLDREIAIGMLAPGADHDGLMGALHGVARSSRWPKVAREVLEATPLCAGCDPNAPIAHVGLQVHHKQCSFHVARLLGLDYLELDKRNLIVLGETEASGDAPNHHLEDGHAGDFRRDCNPFVDEDVVTFRGMSTEAIKADSRYQAHVAAAPPDWNEWTDELKVSRRATLLTTLPPDPALLTEYGLPMPEPTATWRPS